MSNVLRSISLKIFGIAVGLLLVMLVVSAWSAGSIDRVSHQLRTLGHSVVPLALDLQDLRNAIDDGELGIAQHVTDGPAACRAIVASAARVAAGELKEAREDVRLGQSISRIDPNRTEFARMMPLIDQLGEL
ncbi:hypothetical protein Q4F19_00225 [Sphingomonas sp. BIUV-7]|uniref:Methyl-accepting chemotaxis protein n=1 Tax=Sphingomonas natans TaxID=3063330 RepID=A0ABT8Y478_9SPHN|nr:hypothetical protein [Sphingomonas sp. BIUV-7]MDO6412797.1 hypothetical protein [Sphingomonas sp. BIUV-7]